MTKKGSLRNLWSKLKQSQEIASHTFAMTIEFHFCKRIDEPVTNTPTIHAVMRHARVAANKDLKPSDAISLLLSVAIAEIPPTRIAIDAR